MHPSTVRSKYELAQIGPMSDIIVYSHCCNDNRPAYLVSVSGIDYYHSGVSEVLSTTLLIGWCVILSDWTPIVYVFVVCLSCCWRWIQSAILCFFFIVATVHVFSLVDQMMLYYRYSLAQTDILVTVSNRWVLLGNNSLHSVPEHGDFCAQIFHNVM